MKTAVNQVVQHKPAKRTFRTGGAILALLTLPLLLNLGCSDGVMDKFKTAAFGDLETGLKAVLNGVVTGVFAMNGSADSSSTSSSSTSS